jgi:2-polyprenyl-6-methoxyphenol hydroxylase-like FAD-dependent oxidoreductase
MNQKKIPTILIIGAGPGGLALAHSIQKNLNASEKKFNVKIYDRESSPQGINCSFYHLKYTLLINKFLHFFYR